MTKKEALVRVTKLRRLAERAGSPQEAANARRAIADVCRTHSLSEADITIGTKAEAFDDLMGRLDAVTKGNKDLPHAVAEVLAHLKADMKEEEKAGALEKTVAAVRVGALFLGRKKMGALKDVVEETLKRHSLVI